jgi:hypothetical protein
MEQQVYANQMSQQEKIKEFKKEFMAGRHSRRKLCEAALYRIWGVDWNGNPMLAKVENDQ